MKARLLSALFVAIVLPACSSGGKSTDVQAPNSNGTVTVQAQLINVEHDGHIYVVGLFQNGGTLIHSPSCPFDNLPGLPGK